MSRQQLQHAVVILAAGASRRLGTPKQLLTLYGESLVNRTIRIALETHPKQTVLVHGHQAADIVASIKYSDVDCVTCTDWQNGMSASLRSGLQHVHAGCEGALILLCDQHHLNAPHLNRLCATWRQHPDHAIASAYANIAGVPALLPRSWFGRVSSIHGDQGARELLRQGDNVIRVAAPEMAQDIDTPQDLST